jgi:uncharacterized glyoxalase superfamily protein PhnB
MKSLSPNIFVKDMKASIAFYQQLGFNLIMSVPEDGNELVWAMMINGGVTIMFQTFNSLADDLPEVKRIDGGSLLFYIKLRDLLSFFEQIKEKVTIVKGLEKTFYGATEFSILDNNGYLLTFAEDL